MEKIKISLLIDGENNITIENQKTGNKFLIQYDSKILNAQNVYDLFEFKKGNSYAMISNIDSIEIEKIREYFNDIITLFDDIISNLNDLVINDDGSSL